MNRWSERHQLESTMRLWLEREEERKVFRAGIDRVLTGRGGRVRINDIVDLCAAVESLPTSVAGNPLEKQVRKRMAQAAWDILKEDRQDIGVKQVSGALSVLGRPSLRDRLQALATQLTPQLQDEELSSALDRIVRYRQAGAHGLKLTQETDLYSIAVTEFLAALCVLFDLGSCGVPNTTKSGGAIYPGEWLHRGLTELRMLQEHARQNEPLGTTPSNFAATQDEAAKPSALDPDRSSD